MIKIKNFLLEAILFLFYFGFILIIGSLLSKFAKSKKESDLNKKIDSYWIIKKIKQISLAHINENIRNICFFIMTLLLAICYQSIITNDWEY